MSGASFGSACLRRSASVCSLPACHLADRVAKRDLIVRVKWLELGLMLAATAFSLLVPALELPHPRLAERAFVLEPLAELAGEVRHPVLGVSLAELAARVRDPDAVRPFAPGRPWPAP